MISTSSGRCFSKAAISGALQEVCPPTMAPSFVAVERIDIVLVSFWVNSPQKGPNSLTRSIGSDNSIYQLCLNAVDNIVAQPRDKVAVGEYFNILSVSRMSTDLPRLAPVLLFPTLE